MANLKRLKMNSAGVKNLLKSTAVANDMNRRAMAIESALPTADGEVWRRDQFMGSDRVQTIVGTKNGISMLTQAENNSLMRALDRGR